MTKANGTVPIDRAEAKAIAREHTREVRSSSVAAFDELSLRIDMVESTVTGLVTAVRGGTTPMNGHALPTPEIKGNPDFRRLGIKDSELRKLVRDLHVDGWKMDRSGSEPRQGNQAGSSLSLQLPSTPSDHRAVENARHTARTRKERTYEV